MTSSKILLAAVLATATSSFALAGPGIQYWQQRRASQLTAAKAVAPAAAPVASTATPCCRVVTKQRPVTSHKTSMQVQTVECSGCPAMQAGAKCPPSS